MACGSLARATVAVLLIPLDTCKTRLQFQGAMSNDAVRRYRGMTDAFKAILREEGFLAFYRGLLYIGPAAGISFAMYEWFKRSLENVRDGTGHRLEPLLPVLAGSGGRVLATAFKIPFDVVKQRLEVQGALRVHHYESMYQGTVDAFRKIWTHEGLRYGLWRGFSVTLMRDLPFAATYFTAYEIAKGAQTRHLLARVPEDRRSPMLATVNHLAAGAWAGAAATVVTTPLDGIKTRIQTDRIVDRDRYSSLRPVSGTPAPTPAAAIGTTVPGLRARGIVATAANIYMEDGVRGFFRGLPPRLLAVLPSSAITFASYEFFKVLLHA